jgi:hypothetical protein
MSIEKAKIKVTSTLGNEKDIRELLWRIVLDYCKRFKVKVKKGPWEISVVIADYRGEDNNTGMTSIQDTKIIVQVNDPYFCKEDQPNNDILNWHFLTVLCHEFVHVAQELTSRMGIRARVMMQEEDADSQYQYYFDPQEIEARILDEYYLRYVPDSLWASVQAVNAKEDA